MNMQRCQPACPGWQRIYLMDSIIARFSERVLLLKTEAYLIITSQIDVILHLASPQMASLHLKIRSILCGSSSFSITISLQTNGSKKTTSFVLGSYLVQKSHGMLTPSSIHSCKNCLSLWSGWPHMMPSRAASSPSMPMSSLALVTFRLFPCSCTWKGTIPCVPVKCVRSKVFASQTHETSRSTCCCPIAIIPCQPMSLSIIWTSYCCISIIAWWHKPSQWSLCLQKYGERSLQRPMASKGSPFSVLSGPWGFPSCFCSTLCIWSGKTSSWISSSSGLAATREWMRVSNTSWIHIFGRTLVLPPQKWQKWYLHHLVRPFPIQQQIIRVSHLWHGRYGLCSLPPLCFDAISPKSTITNTSAPS